MICKDKTDNVKLEFDYFEKSFICAFVIHFFIYRTVKIKEFQ